jgi:hypothetical protein
MTESARTRFAYEETTAPFVGDSTKGSAPRFLYSPVNTHKWYPQRVDGEKIAGEKLCGPPANPGNPRNNQTQQAGTTGPPCDPSTNPTCILGPDGCSSYTIAGGVAVWCPPLRTPPLAPWLQRILSGVTWADTFASTFATGWFTQGLSDEPGTCTAVFINSMVNSPLASPIRGAGRLLTSAGSGVQNGLANFGPQAQSVVGATAAGGQLSLPVAAVATNIIEGTGELASAAAPYVVSAGGYFVGGATDFVLFKAVAAERAATNAGQCAP